MSNAPVLTGLVKKAGLQSICPSHPGQGKFGHSLHKTSEPSTRTVQRLMFFFIASVPVYQKMLKEAYFGVILAK